MAIKWSKAAVEHLWVAMEDLAPQRRRDAMPAWWALVAQRVNDTAGLGTSGKACANKAAEVRRLGRPYPWEVGEVRRPDLLREIKTQLDRIEEMLKRSRS